MRPPESAAPTRNVTAEERESYGRDGVVLLRGIYSADWVAYLETQLREVLGVGADGKRISDQPESSQRGRIRTDIVEVAKAARAADATLEIAVEGGAQAEMTGRSIVETDPSSWHEGLHHHHVRGPLPEIIAQLAQTRQVNFYADQLYMKEPGSRMKTPFHQDQPNFVIRGGDVAVCWVSVDEVTLENGAMGYVRGSHRWGKTFKNSNFLTETGTFPEDGVLDISQLEQLQRINADDPNLVYVEAKPGDVIVHHWQTIHGSAGNVSANKIRRAASIRYACDGCHFYLRPSSPEPFRTSVGLQDGEALENAERFPIVWPR